MNKLLNKIIFFAVIFFVILISIAKFSFVNSVDILVVGAMESEVQKLKSVMLKSSVLNEKSFKITKGKIGNNSIVILKSGVGKVNASISTQFAIDKFRPKLIINSGIAGGIDKEINKKDIILANSLIQHDFDITAFGYPLGYHSKDKKIGEATADIKMTEIAQKIIKNKYPKINVQIGKIATGDKFVSDKYEKLQINKEFSALAVDMESYAIAKTANLNNIPCLILRVISDSLYEDDLAKYDKNEENIANFSSDVLIEILKEMKI